MVDPFLWARCRIKTRLDDLVAYLAALQLQAIPPLLVASGARLMLLVPGMGFQEPCILEAEAGNEIRQRYLVIELRRGGYTYRFTDELPETMEAKVYPIIHLVEA